MKFTNMRNIIMNIYLFITAVIIVSAIIYFRIYQKKHKYEILDLKYNLSSEYILICVIFILCHLIIITKIIHGLFNTNNKEFFLTKYLKIPLEILIIKPLNYLHDVIAPYLPYSGQLIITYEKYFRTASLNKFYIFMFSLAFLPRLIVSLTFFIEIIFYKKIYYFVNISILILIPLIYKVFNTLSSSFVERNLPEVEKPMIIKNVSQTPPKFTFELTKEAISLGYKENNLKEHSDMWMRLFFLDKLNIVRQQYLEKWSPYITLFCSLLYFIAGSYKLFLLLL